MVAILLLCFVTTGCTGSFNLTKKVYNFHRSQSDKWYDELLFLVCVIVPVYGISTFADAIVFNSIEFWTGDNPIDMAKTETQMKNVKAGKTEATLSYNTNNDQITITSKDHPTVVLEKTDKLVLAKNDKGEVLYGSKMNDQGELVLYDRDLQVVKKFTPDEIASIKQRMSK
jgi:hypothetical protein